MTRYEWHESWVIEQHWCASGESTGLFVYDRIGKSFGSDTTGWLCFAKTFRFKWTAMLWNAIYNQSYWSAREWRVVGRGWVKTRNPRSTNGII